MIIEFEKVEKSFNVLCSKIEEIRSNLLAEQKAMPVARLFRRSGLNLIDIGLFD